MKKVINRICILMATVVLLSCFAVFSANAAAAVTFSTPAPATQNADRGSTFTLAIVMSNNTASTAISVTGIDMSVSYDNTKLAYVSGPVQTDVPALSSSLIHDNVNESKVKIAWTTNASASLPPESKIYTLTFRVLENAATGNTKLIVNINDVYDIAISGGGHFETLTYNDSFEKTVNITSNNGLVNSVISAINAIGDVKYDSNSLNKINNAAALYQLLTLDQKQAVTNYQVLLNAQLEYDRLKNLAAETALNNTIAGFLQDHAYALTLTSETVQLADKIAITNAQNAYDALPVEAKYRYEVNRYNAQLKATAARLAVLEKNEKDRIEAEKKEREQKEEAQQYASDFIKENTYFLSLKESEVVPDHISGLNNAIALINMLSGLNPYVTEYLQQEHKHLENLLEAAQRLAEEKGDGPSPQQIEADKFLRNFSWLLSQTPNTIAADDIFDIMMAMELYRMQDSDVQNLLKSEYQLLLTLYERSQELEDDGGDSGSTLTPTDGTDPLPTEGTDPLPPEGTDPLPTEVVPGKTVVIEKDGKTVFLSGREIGVVIPIMLMLMLLSSIILVTLQVFYHIYIKRKKHSVL